VQQTQSRDYEAQVQEGGANSAPCEVKDEVNFGYMFFSYWATSVVEKGSTVLTTVWGTITGQQYTTTAKCKLRTYSSPC